MSTILDFFWLSLNFKLAVNRWNRPNTLSVPYLVRITTSSETTSQVLLSLLVFWWILPRRKSLRECMQAVRQHQFTSSTLRIFSWRRKSLLSLIEDLIWKFYVGFVRFSATACESRVLKMSKLKGAFQRVFKSDISLNSFGDLLRAFRKLSFLHFCRWIKNHYDILLE